MRCWNVDRSTLKVALRDEFVSNQAKVPYEMSVSPDKKKCVYVYGIIEPRMGFVFGNFMLLKRVENDVRIILKSDDNHIACWMTLENIRWSDNSRFLVIDVCPLIGGWLIAKMVVDIYAEKISIILLAGGLEQTIRIRDDVEIEIFQKPGIPPTHYIPVIKAKTRLSSLKWVKMSDFNKITDKVKKGFFGDIIGFKNTDSNRRLKNGYIPWPYKGIVKRRPK